MIANPVNPAWTGRVRLAREAAIRHKSTRDSLVEQHAEKTREVEVLSLRMEKLAKVGELLRMLMDKLVGEQRKVVEGLVSKGLRAVFHDQDLSFETEVVQRAGRVEIDLYFKRGSDEMAVRGNPLDSFGGGPTSVTSLVLRVLALRRLGRRPFLFLDETLSAVSDEYIDATSQLLQRLCSAMGIDVLLVTHKHSFLDHAESAYQGSEEVLSDGSTKLALRRVREKAA